MIGSESSHCNLLRESIAGSRSVDEDTFASLAILTERLDRVRKSGGAFAGVAFSPQVKKMARKRHVAAVS